jgi:hypothetical protein
MKEKLLKMFELLKKKEVQQTDGKTRLQCSTLGIKHKHTRYWMISAVYVNTAMVWLCVRTS